MSDEELEKVVAMCIGDPAYAAGYFAEDSPSHAVEAIVMLSHVVLKLNTMCSEFEDTIESMDYAHRESE